MKFFRLLLFTIHCSCVPSVASEQSSSALFTIGAIAADYNIVSYGAKSDTTVLSTVAIQQAIDDCSKTGGGRVVVPAGSYKTGTIVLKSDVHLYLEKGATLYGSTDLKDYRPMKSDFVSLYFVYVAKVIKSS